MEIVRRAAFYTGGHWPWKESSEYNFSITLRANGVVSRLEVWHCFTLPCHAALPNVFIYRVSIRRSYTRQGIGYCERHTSQRKANKNIIKIIAAAAPQKPDIDGEYKIDCIYSGAALAPLPTVTANFVMPFIPCTLKWKKENRTERK